MSKPVVKISWGRLKYYLLCIKFCVPHTKAYPFKKLYHYIVAFYSFIGAFWDKVIENLFFPSFKVYLFPSSLISWRIFLLPWYWCFFFHIQDIYMSFSFIRRRLYFPSLTFLHPSGRIIIDIEEFLNLFLHGYPPFL